MHMKDLILPILTTLALAPGCRRVCDCVVPDVAPDDPDDDSADLAADPDDAVADPAVDDPELGPGGVEARGIWVTRWDYSCAADILTIMDRAAFSGLNQIYFQVRGTADAYYDSSIEPWAAGLGELGVDPGWDPLAVAVTEAHARGLELHTWLNTFPMWTGTSPPPSSTPEHIYNAHPEWICADSSGVPMPLNGSYVFGSPGNPDLQDHIAAVVADIAAHYDVDGIHMDYIRYPGTDYCHDAASEARFAAASAADPGLTRADWQRDQIRATLVKIRAAMDAVDPSITLSTAVWGIYRNTWGWSSVSQGYVDYYQDPRDWTGIVDAVVPMIYWSIAEPYASRLDFRALLDDHVAGNAPTPVYAGIEGNYASFDEIASQIAYSRDHGARGYVIFAFSYIVDNDTFDDLLAGPNADFALAP